MNIAAATPANADISMWKKAEKPVPIDPSQVVIGLYVWLDVSWDEHPFLYNRFKVCEKHQVETIRAMPVAGKVYYYPDKSTANPGPVLEKVVPQATEVAEVSPQDDLEQQIAQQNREKHELLRQQRDAAARADRAWEQAARVTREAIVGMGRTPKQAGAQLLEMSRDNARLIALGKEVLLHLMGDRNGDGPQFHALNVMTLSMLLGKNCGLTEQQLVVLSMGALAHDVGKLRIPQHILRSNTRARHEEQFYREHSAYGAELARIAGCFDDEATAIIADHHEFLDGTGWPSGKRNASLVSRIVALTNRYDRLCTPEAPGREPLMPAEALSRLYRVESAKFDQRLLSMLIKLLGVFPPGTIVRLNDESLGMVISPGKESLRPTILVYNPEMERSEAPAVDLAQAPELKIEEALRPSSLPADVLQWINPRQRLSYFFSVDQGG